VGFSQKRNKPGQIYLSFISRKYICPGFLFIPPLMSSDDATFRDAQYNG